MFCYKRIEGMWPSRNWRGKIHVSYVHETILLLSAPYVSTGQKFFFFEVFSLFLRRGLPSVMVVEDSAHGGSEWTRGAHESADQMEVGLELVTRGNVDSVKVRRVSAAEPELSANLRIDPLGVLDSLLDPARQARHVDVLAF